MQGLTLPRVIIDMKLCFSHGMLYTAISRVRTFKDIVVRGVIKDSWMLASPVVVDFVAMQEFIMIDNSVFDPVAV